LKVIKAIIIIIPCSIDFTLLFRVYYPDMISGPVSFAIFPVNASPRTLLLDLFYLAVWEFLVSASLSACFQLLNFLYHEIEIPFFLQALEVLCIRRWHPPEL